MVLRLTPTSSHAFMIEIVFLSTCVPPKWISEPPVAFS